MTFLHKIFSPIALIATISTHAVFAQITGPTVVATGTTHVYTYTGSVPPTPSWTVSGGTKISSTSTTVTIQWSSSPGSGSMLYKSKTTIVDDLAVFISSPPAAPSVTNASRCGAGSVTLTASGAQSGDVYKWYDASEVTLLHTGSSYTTPSISQTTTYWVGLENELGIGGPRTQATATILSIPTAPETVTPSYSSCGPSAFALTPSVAPGEESSYNYKWYATPSGGSPVATTTGAYNTGVMSGNTNYYFTRTVVTGMCESSRRTVPITIHPVPTALPAASDVSRCGSGTVTLTASGGTDYRWYNASSGGTLLSSASSYTTSISTTRSYWVEFINTQGCSGPREEVQAIVISLPAMPVADNQSRCGTGSVTLSATGTPSGGTYYWWDSATLGEQLATGAAYGTPQISASQSYWVSAVNSSGCQSSRRQADAIVLPIPSAPGVSSLGGTTRCGPASFTISATLVSGEPLYDYKWYTTETGGSPVSISRVFETPVIPANTTYYVSRAGGCESSRTGITLTIHPVPTTLPTAPDVSRCGMGAVTLNASGGPGYRWYDAASGGTLLRSVSSYTTPSISSTQSYYVAFANEHGCIGPREEVQAVIDPVPALPLADNQSRCGTGSVSLTASGTPSEGSYNWYNVSTGGTVLSTINSYTTPSISSTTSYWVSAVSTQGCEGARKEVSAVVMAIPAGPSISGITSRCGPDASFSLSAVVVSGDPLYEYEWFTVASGGTLVSTSKNYTTPSLSNSTTYYVSRSEGTGSCESPRTSVPLIVYDPAALPLGTNVSRYGAGEVTLSASGSSNGYKWYAVSSGGSSLYEGNNYAPFVSQTTSYYVTGLTANGCEGPRYEVQAVILDPADIQIIITGEPVLTLGGEHPVLSLNLPFYSYQWIKDGVDIPGATALTYTVTETGNYSVRVAAGFNSPDAYTTPGVEISGLYANANQCTTTNFVVSTEIWKPGIDTKAKISALNRGEFSQTVSFFDDIGRPLQAVTLGSSPLEYDIVSPVAYDEYGRTTKQYLPYVTENRTGLYRPQVLIATDGTYANSEQQGFYQHAENIAHDQRPFSETILEPSPLSRPEKQYGPGEAWKNASDDRPIRTEFGFNGAGEVKKWTLGDVSVSEASHYPANVLHKTISTDEDNHRVLEFRNMEGHVVLKKVETGDAADPWAETYYIYDDFNNLRVVLPPMASNSGLSTLNDSFLARWAFCYTYNERQLMITKRVPGAEPVYMVYDNRDRLVMTQDGNQRSGTNKYWTFTKYDILNRPVLTGIKDTSLLLTQEVMQSVVNAHYDKPWAKWGESFEGTSGPIYGYSNKSYPVVTTGGVMNKSSYLTVNYYDNYDFLSLWYGDYSYKDEALAVTVNGVTYNQPSSACTGVVGLQTGSIVKILDGTSGGWLSLLKSATYYDDNYRVIQTHGDNYKAGIDRISNLYDFTGKVLKSHTTHTEYDIVWKDVQNLVQSGNTLFNPGPTQWDNEAISTKGLPASVDGWMEWTANNAAYKIIGLTASNDPVLTRIDYSFYFLYTTGYIREGGTNVKEIPGGYQVGDVFRIEREGSTIYYYKNGSLIHTSAVPSMADLFVDVAMYSADTFIKEIKTSFSGSSHSITKRFEYDHAGRLINLWHKLDEAPEILLTHNDYNELGQLIDKKLHSTNSTASDAKQSVDYRYNIRGWLTSMNNASLTSNTINDDSGDLFGFELGYNTDIGVGNASLFNGNISAMKWSTNLGLGEGASEPSERAYTFGYDPMNRLESASHHTRTTSWNPSTAFHEDNLSYDLNGNILYLNRKDKNGDDIDVLSYNYGTGPGQSNQLRSVTDDGDDQEGFKELNTGGDDYVYDSNGNLVWDKNKGGGDLAKNGSFESGSTNWTIAGESSRLTFVDGDVNVALGSQSVTLTQNGVLIPNQYYVVIVDMVQNTSAGKITVRLGGGLANVSGTGKQVIVTQAGSGSNIVLIPTASFSGAIRSVEVKSITVITYNHLNLPQTVTHAGDKSLRYIYDATGRKLSQEVLNGGTVIKKTDYAGEFFYENDTLKFINHEEGRIVMTGTTPEYQYNLKDHLGNVRLTFTTKDEIEEATATLETENLAEEQSNFLNLNEAVIVNHEIFDHTSNGTTNETYNATRLAGGSTGENFGLARSLSVMPGDQINMEVWAKYLDPDPETWEGTTYENFLLQYTSSPPPGVIIDGGLPGSLGSGIFPYASLLVPGTVDETAPKAFLTWLVFDRDFNPILSESGFAQIGLSAKETGTNSAHQLLTRSSPLTITKPGYVYIYLSNENETPVEVFFDDFKVEHVKSPVVQMDDYYPFGLAFNSYSRENSTPNKYKFNGKEEQTELGLGWFDYGARMYDPTVSRWMTIDPLASKYLSMSPYAYVANNPIKFIDPDGKKIIIFGARYGFLGLRRHKYEYHAGASAPEGANQFAKDSFKALNHARGGDKNGIIDALAESDDKHVYVKRTGKSNGFYNQNNNTIRWNSEMGAELLDEDERVTGRQPAALVLFHEVGHGYRENFIPEEYYNDLATDDDQYVTVEERKVIENYETPAAKELGYGTRTNHGGRLYPTDGPTSTTPLRVNSPRAPKLDIDPQDKKPDYLGSAGPADGRKRINEKTNGY